MQGELELCTSGGHKDEDGPSSPFPTSSDHRVCSSSRGALRQDAKYEVAVPCAELDKIRRLDSAGIPAVGLPERRAWRLSICNACFPGVRETGSQNQRWRTFIW